jgi:hypothetical protein
MSRPCPTEAEITARIEVTRIALREHVADLSSTIEKTYHPGTRFRLLRLLGEARGWLAAAGEQGAA